jgi:hypothetical protein
VSWTNQSTANHRNKVWVFVDFQPVISPIQKGNWQPATITGTVQKTAGTVSEQSNRGFFLEGTTTGFASTVTVTLSNVTGKFNWCAYASDYPPNVTYSNVTYNGGTYTFKGTPPFKLVSADGSQTQEFNKKSITVSEIGFVPKNFTDATGCPGIGFCPYTGNDEVMDASHFCHLRTADAKNWETWIKDSRDDKIYRITQFSDNSWWFAEDMTINDKVWSICGGFYYYNPSNKPNCPTNWRIPTYSEITNRWPTSVNVTADVFGASLGMNPTRYCTINCNTLPAPTCNSYYNACNILSADFVYYAAQYFSGMWMKGGCAENVTKVICGGRVRCVR